MDARLMASKLLDARRTWFELDEPPRRALRLQRPAELELSGWGRQTAQDFGPKAMQQVVDWRGFTEADLLGAALASDDPQEFSREVFDLWAADHIEEFGPVVARLLELIQTHQAKKAADLGNSTAS